ncbi:MAG: hypothetical protein M1819_002986 [Sarea resinae]|nr:MAG: hypothetical protein M1819_002986 [Sarea resinae]
MVLLGLSILLASLSFLIYRHPLSTWTAPFGSLHAQAKDLRRHQPVQDTREEDQAKDLHSDMKDPVDDEQDGCEASLKEADLEKNDLRASSAAASHSTTLPATPPTPSRAPSIEPPSIEPLPTEPSEQSPSLHLSISSSTPSPESTPRAGPRHTPPSHSSSSSPQAVIPTLSLSSSHASPPFPSFPAANSAQRASAAQNSALSPTPRAPPRLNPLPATQTATSLMPPPPVPNRSLNPSPRAPTASSLSPAAQRRQPNRTVLKPGHSPLDWALYRSRILSAPASATPALIKVTPSLLSQHNGRRRPRRKAAPLADNKDIDTEPWTAYHGRVYNLAPYLAFHPGGEGELLRAAGKDAADLFDSVHPWVNWEGILGVCCIGILVPEGDDDDDDADNGADGADNKPGAERAKSSLDDMD